MWWAAGIQAGLSLFGAKKMKDAGKDARRIANMNADAQWADFLESDRRTRAQFRQVEGMARTVAAGSGFAQKEGDSQSGYISSMIAEHGRQLRYSRKAAASQKKIIQEGGQLAYKQASANALGMVGQAIGQIGEAWSLKNG